MENENKRPTQVAKVLRHLEMYGFIDPLTALSEYSIMRLQARIFELKEQGYGIVTKMTKSKNKFGEPVHYATYHLKEEIL